MYDGYLSFGGNEVVNNDRARGYAETADCPMFWFKGPLCPGVRPITEGTDVPYDYADIQSAPWYDAALPELSTRFYGSFGLTFKSFVDSTRTASVVQGIDDGGVIGRTRKAVREVRVKTLLAARGADALDYGMGWLSAALDPGACGQHGTECGTADLAFFADCPGSPGDYTRTEYDITTTRKNLALNPSGGIEELSGTILSWEVTAPFTIEQVDGWGAADNATRITRTTTGNARASAYIGEYAINTTYVITAKVRASEPLSVTGSLRQNASDTNNAVNAPARAIPAGESEQVWSLTSKGSAPTPTASFSFVYSQGAIGSTLDVADLIVEVAPAPVWTQSRYNHAKGTTGNATRTTGTLAPRTYPAQGAVQIVFSAAGNLAWWDAFSYNPPQATGDPRVPITEGQTLRASADWASVADLRRIRWRIQWYDAAGVALGSLITHTDGRQPAVGQYVSESHGEPFRTEQVAPAGAGFVGISLQSAQGSPAASPLGFEVGDGYNFRSLLVTVDDPDTTFFDGTTVSADPLKRYAWTGTPDFSWSYEETTPEPVPGSFFDGYTLPYGQMTYAWAGVPYASVSVETQTIPFEVPDADAYERAMRGVVRFLHGVGAISGPLVVAEYEVGEFNAYEVEFTMDAETPWVFSAMRELALTPSLPVTVQDTPYNLVPYPSAELAGANVVVARNLATNPSVETDVTGITGTATVISGTSPAAYYTTGRSTELAAVGGASFRQRILGNLSTTVTGAKSRLIATQTVPLTGVTAGQRVSFSMWLAAVISTGSAVSTVDAMSVSVEWLNGATPISTQVLGTLTASQFPGAVVASPSLLPPATATNARVFATADVTWGSSATAANNSDIRIYTDALLVSVP